MKKHVVGQVSKTTKKNKKKKHCDLENTILTHDRKHYYIVYLRAMGGWSPCPVVKFP